MNISEVPLNQKVTVRVKGEAKRLSSVTLVPHASDPSRVTVQTGRRGRPRHLSGDQITSVNVLKS